MAIPSCNTCERDKASEQDTQSQIEAANFRLRFPFELAASFIWSQSEKEKRGKKKKEKKKKKRKRERENGTTTGSIVSRPVATTIATTRLHHEKYEKNRFPIETILCRLWKDSE